MQLDVYISSVNLEQRPFSVQPKATLSDWQLVAFFWGDLFLRIFFYTEWGKKILSMTVDTYDQKLSKDF